MKLTAVVVIICSSVMTLFSQVDTKDFSYDLERYIQRQDLKLLVRSGLLHFDTGEYVKARQELEEAVKKGVNLPEIYNYLGLIYDRFEEYSRSVDYYEKALSLDRRYLPARINSAVAYFNRNDFAVAEAQLKTLFSEYPNLMIIKYNMGVLHLKRGNPVKAEAEFAELMSSSYEHKARAAAQLAYIAMKRNNVKKMEEELARAFASDRYDPFVFYMAGLMYMELEDYGQARLLFNQALSLQKSYPRALYQIASLEYIEGSLTAAIGYMSKAVEMVPENADYLTRMADLYSASKNYNEAERMYITALKHARGDARAKTYGLFIVYSLSKNDLAQAQSLLVQAKKEFAANPFVTCAEYFVMLERNMQFDYAQAIQLIRKQYDVMKDYPLMYLVYGEILRALDEKTAAIQQVKEGAKLSPSFYRMRFLLANIYRDSRLYKEAVEEYNKYLKVYPNYGPAYNGMALTFSEIQQLGKAEETLLKGIEKAPEYAPLYSNLGHVYTKMNRPNDSMKYYDKALAINPNLPEAWNNKILLLLDLKQYDKALAAWETIRTKWPDNPDMQVLSRRMEQVKDIIQWSQQNKDSKKEPDAKKGN